MDRETDGIVTEQRALDAIREKVEANERLDLEDGLTLMESDDLLALGELADTAPARARRHGRGLLRPEPLPEPDERLPREVQVLRVRRHAEAGAAPTRSRPRSSSRTRSRQRELTGFTEIHMVNGENPHVGFDFYVDTIRALHEAMPDVHLKLYTASEIHHMTTLSGLSHEQVLVELKAAGLGSLPGGGAEVFADRVRRLVAPGKEHPDFWFHTHEPRTGSGSRRTARCSTATSRPTRSGSTTFCACASSRTRPAASSPSSRSRSTRRTPSSSGAAGRSRPARTT